jgi:hypothetical protein
MARTKAKQTVSLFSGGLGLQASNKPLLHADSRLSVVHVPPAARSQGQGAPQHPRCCWAESLCRAHPAAHSCSTRKEAAGTSSNRAQ